MTAYRIKTFLLGLLLLGSCIYSAIYSVGYYHADEHFQLLEFAYHFLGGGNELAWEFDAQIRPTIQVFVAVGVMRLLEGINVSDPFTQVTVLRFLSLILSLVSFFFVKRVFIKKELSWDVFFLSCIVIWFLPYMAVRFNSETWSGSLFALGLAMLYDKGNKNNLKLVIIGVFLGLSFFVRFQIAFFLIAVFVHQLVVEKTKSKTLYLLLGGVVAVLGCVFLDVVFYGELVFTPYNYFFSNIIEGVASSFGESPWYWYFNKFLEKGVFIPSSIVLLSFVFFSIKNKTKVITWCSWCFLIGHILVAHKELRFLYPITLFLPVMLVYTYRQLNTYKVIRVLFLLSIVVGSVLTVMLAKLINYDIRSLELLTEGQSEDKHLYLMIDSKENKVYHFYHLTHFFYAKESIVKQITQVEEVEELDVDIAGDVYVYTSNRELQVVLANQGYQVEVIERKIPLFVQQNLNFNKWVDRNHLPVILKFSR